MTDRFSEALKNRQQGFARALNTLSKLGTVLPDPLEGVEICRLESMRVLHYAPAEVRYQEPLLICYALINRPYILDLEPKRSLLRDLLKSGHSVYLIDWGYPQDTDQHLGLDDYIGDYLHHAVTRCLKHSDSDRLDLLGVCQGGVFALCYAQLYPDLIGRLITLVTPIDTEVSNFTLAQMVRDINVDALIAAQGNLSGEMLNQLYNSLKPLELGLYKQLNLADNLSSQTQARTFLRMEHWLNDTPDLAARGAREFANGFFKQNGLSNASLIICGKRMDLGQLRQPVLNAFGRSDHLVPPDSSKALADLLEPSVHYTEVELNGGHIGALISQANRRKLVSHINRFRKP